MTQMQCLLQQTTNKLHPIDMKMSQNRIFIFLHSILRHLHIFLSKLMMHYKNNYNKNIVHK